MRPFSLEEAKAGVPICTRNGRSVVIYDFSKIDLQGCDNPKPIVAKIKFEEDDGIQESVYEFHRDGRLHADEEGPLDLMMADQKVTVWANVYSWLGVYARAFNSEELARKDAEEHPGYETLLATKEITIEV